MDVRLLGAVAVVASAMVAGLPAQGGPIRGDDGPKFGEAAPGIVAVDAAGDSYQLEHLEPLRGKVVLLTFWTLDPETLSGMPLDRLGPLSREFADERFHILTVCVNASDDLDAWSAFWLRHVRGGEERAEPHFGGLRWWVLMQSDVEEPTTARRYGVVDTPGYFLIGPDGRLAAVRIPPEQLREAIGHLLKQQP